MKRVRPTTEAGYQTVVNILKKDSFGKKRIDIVEKYNGIYKVQMPKVTPHICRHTYCSNMAKSGMNPKTLQYLMGHSDISVTLNVYTHVNFDDAKAELIRMKVI